MSNLYPSFSFNEDCLPKNNGIIKEITSLISEYKNNLQHIATNNLTETQDELIYLITRAIKKYLESEFWGQAMTDGLKVKMENEIRNILNAVTLLNPIDSKLKWECVFDKHNNSVTLRAYINEH